MYLNNPPSLSVVIPSRGDDVWLNRTLRKLARQNTSRLQIIVVLTGPGAIHEEGLTWLRSMNYVVASLVGGGTAGAARNFGSDLASGDYIWFLDSDDVPQPNAISEILESMHSGADIICFSALCFDASTGERSKPSWYLDSRGVLELDELLDLMTCELDPFRLLISSPAPWLRPIRADFLRNSKLRFEDRSSANDLRFYVESMLRAQTVLARDVPIVSYGKGRPHSLSANETEHALARIEALKTTLELAIKWHPKPTPALDSLILFAFRNFGGAQLSLGRKPWRAAIELLRFRELIALIQRRGYLHSIMLLGANTRSRLR